MKEKKRKLLESTENLYKVIAHVSTLSLSSEYKKIMRDKIDNIESEKEIDIIMKETAYLHELIVDLFVVMVDARKLIKEKDMEEGFVMATIMSIMTMPKTANMKKKIGKRVRQLWIADTYREIEKGNKVKQIK